MLSICIPIFNCNVSGLVYCLDNQAKDNGIVFEIILIDDYSENEFRLKNKELSAIESVLYIELGSNIGRSAIRNLFLNYTRFDYLLYLDCDSQVSNNQFIDNYISHCKQDEIVICGGTVYPVKPIDQKINFRWKYGVSRECVSSQIREKKPFHFFKTNNFVVSKKVLTNNKFDERLSNYGHEDSLFAYQLMKKNVQVIHINNPVIHEVTESFAEYLSKTKQALKNLHLINSKLDLGADFIEMNRLLTVYKIISKYYLQFPLLLLFGIFQPIIHLALVLGTINLKLFDLYKLGYYHWVVLTTKNKFSK